MNSVVQQPIKQFSRVRWLVGAGLVLVAFGLYVFTLAPTVLQADGGEFQFVAWLPGIAHPTGYPLYVITGWLWTHLLPAGEVAWRMNLLSAVFAAAAVVLTYAVALRLADLALPDTPALARILGAALAAVVFAVTPAFWSQAIIAEVYALHALFVALILWLTLWYTTPRPEQNLWPGVLLAFTFGLGLTHHSTTILLLPALLVYIWATRPIGTESKASPKTFAIYGLAFILPLFLYLYLPFIAPSTPYATLFLSNTQTLTLYNNSLQGFLQHITGTVFAKELQPEAVGLERFRLVWQLLQHQVSWVGIILAAIGVFTLWRRQQVSLLLLTGIAFLTFVAFNLIYFVGDVFVLFIPAWLIVCLWLGMGALGLTHWIANHFVRRKMGVQDEIIFVSLYQRLKRNMYQLVTIILLLFFFALPIVMLVKQMPEINQRYNVAARDRWQAVLQQPIPNSAILISNDRNEIMPMWYYQYVEGQRLDLLGLFPLIVTDAAYANVGRVLDQALKSERPVYFIKQMDGLSLKADIEPEGLLFKATSYPSSTPAYANPVTLSEVVVTASSGSTHGESIKLLGYDITPQNAQPGDEITVTLYWQPTQPLTINYTSYVHLLTANEQRVAQSDHQSGGDYYPSSYWQTGEILHDTHVLSIPADTPEGEYRLRVGMYYQPEPGVINGMGNGVEAGQLTVKDCC